MPTWKTHKELSSIENEHAIAAIQEIVGFRGEKLEKYIRMKNPEHLTDNDKELIEVIKGMLSHNCRRDRVCFFIKTQMAYDNFGDVGLREYFLHHTLDYLTWWRKPRMWFGEKIEIKPPSSLTRRQKRKTRNKAIFDGLYELRNMEVRLSHSGNPDILFAFYHTLTEDIFSIEEEEESTTYKFNDKVWGIIEDVKLYVERNFPRILDVIHKNEN